MPGQDHLPRSIAAQTKIGEALAILREAGVPLDVPPLHTNRSRERAALSLLAVANVRPATPWSQAAVSGDGQGHAVSTREIIEFRNVHFSEGISSGSYDDVRRKDLIQLVEFGLVCRVTRPGAATNDPTRKYAVHEKAGPLLRSFGSKRHEAEVNRFRAGVAATRRAEEELRRRTLIPVQLPSGHRLELSAGGHNELQKLVIEEFLKRFGFGAVVLYVGDTANKALYHESQALKEVGLPELNHDKLPDIVARSQQRGWLFLIEVVNVDNPVSPQRHADLELWARNCRLPRVYVSVFKDRKTFRKCIAKIAWETEVWLADEPDHLIHFNGEKFLGPP